jgi:hypothetical protein
LTSPNTKKPTRVHKTKKKKVEIREYEYADEVTCQCCSKAASYSSVDHPFTTNWLSGYTEEKTTVCIKSGWGCPDGGSGKYLVWDICENCLKTILENTVGEPYEIEWDW